LVQNTSITRRTVTIHPPVRLVGEPKTTVKKRKKERKEGRHPKQWQTGYSPRPPTSSEQNQTLHGGWPAVCTCQVWSKSVKGLWRCGGRKWPFPITLGTGLPGIQNTTACTTVQAVTSCCHVYCRMKLAAAIFCLLLSTTITSVCSAGKYSLSLTTLTQW